MRFAVATRFPLPTAGSGCYARRSVFKRPQRNLFMPQSGTSPRPPAGEEVLHRLRSEFLRAWAAVEMLEQVPNLLHFLPPAGEPFRGSALQELILLDLEQRWQ